MADKGIVVDDAASGESVACIDLRNQDNDSNDRIVQLVSPVVSPATLINHDGTPLRTITFGSTDGEGATNEQGDAFETAGSIVEIDTSGVLDLTDCSCFMVYGHFESTKIEDTNDAGDGDSNEIEDVRFTLTPILFPVTGYVVATPLHCALLRFWDKSGHGGATPYEGDVGQTNASNLCAIDYDYDDGGSPTETDTSYYTFKYPFFPLVYPTFGGTKVTFHVRSNRPIQGVLKLFAVALTGEAATAALTQVHTSDHELSSARISCWQDGDSSVDGGGGEGGGEGG